MCYVHTSSKLIDVFKRKISWKLKENRCEQMKNHEIFNFLHCIRIWTLRSVSRPPRLMFSMFLDLCKNLKEYMGKLWISRGGGQIEKTGGIIVQFRDYYSPVFLYVLHPHAKKQLLRFQVVKKSKRSPWGRRILII